MVPLCFIILDIILAHDDLKFTVSVAVVAILRISAPSVALDVFEHILLYIYRIHTVENGKESLLSKRLRKKFLFKNFLR